jgi:hypothetical protein
MYRDEVLSEVWKNREDLDSNGFTDPMDLFLFQRDWMK